LIALVIAFIIMLLVGWICVDVMHKTIEANSNITAVLN
jgi:hypothetical protein